jgi:hypothetical protein
MLVLNPTQNGITSIKPKRPVVMNMNDSLLWPCNYKKDKSDSIWPQILDVEQMRL